MTIPIPASSDMLRNKARAWDAALIESGGRSLESASITRGIFRVNGGSIVIGKGGTLELIDGDLILGEGKIEGRALADQMQAINIFETHSGGHPSNTIAKTLITHTVSAPDWANHAVIMVSIYARTHGVASFDVMLHVNDSLKLRYPSTAAKASDASSWSQVGLSTYSATHEVNQDLTFKLSVENWTSGGPGANDQRLNGVVIWQR